MTITSNYDTGTYTEVTPATGNGFDVILTTNPTTVDGVFLFKPDLTNLEAGDWLEIRVQEKNGAGTLKPLWGPVSFVGPQTVLRPHVRFEATNNFTVEMRQRAGTARAIAWAMDRIT